MTDYRAPGARPDPNLLAHTGPAERRSDLPGRPSVRRHTIVFTGNALEFFAIALVSALVVAAGLAAAYFVALRALVTQAMIDPSNTAAVVMSLLALVLVTAFLFTLLYYIPQRYFFTRLQVEIIEKERRD